MGIWAVLLKFTDGSDGWWTTVVNIFCFLLSAVVTGLGPASVLRAVMPFVFAVILSGIVWAVLVVIIRSVFLTALGVI